MSSRPINSAIPVAIAMSIMVCSSVLAQEVDEQGSDESKKEEAMEEVVVTSSKAGDPSEIQARNEALLRARIEKDMEQLRLLEEEYEWRKEGAATEKEDGPRISWGYDPRKELEVRQDVPPSQWERDRPATLFRVEF